MSNPSFAKRIRGSFSRESSGPPPPNDASHPMLRLDFGNERPPAAREQPAVARLKKQDKRDSKLKNRVSRLSFPRSLCILSLTVCGGYTVLACRCRQLSATWAHPSNITTIFQSMLLPLGCTTPLRTRRRTTAPSPFLPLSSAAALPPTSKTFARRPGGNANRSLLVERTPSALLLLSHLSLATVP